MLSSNFELFNSDEVELNEEGDTEMVLDISKRRPARKIMRQPLSHQSNMRKINQNSGN